MVEYAFRDRELNAVEFERLRLMLSSFRDGSGQVILKGTNHSMPGFRDFERSLAAAVGGETPENKGIFDIYVPSEPTPFGISCKMSRMQPPRSNCSFMELSNSAAKFRACLDAGQINEREEPHRAGAAIVELVGSWHSALKEAVDLSSSLFVILAHSSNWEKFQLLTFPLNLEIADPKIDVTWLYEGASLNGYIGQGAERHRLWQCYLNSGGQLKYFPLLEWAGWTSGLFHLEMPPTTTPFGKAQDYFPDLRPSD